MFPSFPTLEACHQQALALRPPWSVSKAEFDPAEQQLRGLRCAMYGSPRFCKCLIVGMARK